MDYDGPNPLLLGWVKECWDTARRQTSKSASTYKHAYDSLKACPLQMNHPSELDQLKYFGPKLCAQLTDRMQQYCDENGLPMPKRSKGKKKRKAPNGNNATGTGENDTDLDEPSPPAKKPKKIKAYVPGYRSGPYALVLGLATMGEDDRNGMTKADLIEVAQRYTETSFTISEPGTFYTGWSSMNTLKDRELVHEKGRPQKRYTLTDKGWEVARRIQEAAVSGADAVRAQTRQPRSLATSNADSLDPVFEQDPIPQDKKPYADVVAIGPVVSDDSLPSITPIRLSPGSFTVHMVLDMREIRAKTDRTYMQEELAKKGTPPIMRALELGDVLWVAKCHDPNFLPRLGAEGDEIVLDHIVERKRLDDLIGSIKDGRFHEQKFRLKRSGVKHVTYIIEEITLDADHFSKHEDMVQSAIASTQVVDGFTVKKTQKMDDTIRYLARMTALLKKQYESRPLKVIPTKHITAQNYLPLLKHLRGKESMSNYYITYPAFASLASKSDMMTLRDVYLKMLMCTRGVTGEKALLIQKLWKTPHEFVKAFEQCGPGETGLKKKRELVASRMSENVGTKKIAKILSQKIAEIWGT